MREIIEAITQKHRSKGINVYSPVTTTELNAFEEQIGFLLPKEFREFYSICNGFGCNEDIFNMVPLNQIMRYGEDYGTDWFYFSEYMIYSDVWGLRLTSSKEYEIFNGGFPEIVMTSSLLEFLNRFLKGNVFDRGGLYEWHNELGIK
ncbi:MAG TPA: SMI1/KNR4 family protein [Puia sp.]